MTNANHPKEPDEILTPGQSPSHSDYSGTQAWCSPTTSDMIRTGGSWSRSWISG